ncbi:MAG: hypothetical protein AB7S87_15130 [Burkholderiales bacterium]
MKRILVVARHNQAEALRVAAGLTLLSDPVSVVVVGRLASSPAIEEQRELLDFAEVPCEECPDGAGLHERLAPAMLAADAVYVI